MLDGKFSEYRQAFERVDMTGNGKLNAVEIQRVFEELGQPITETKLWKIFDKYDSVSFLLPFSTHEQHACSQMIFRMCKLMSIADLCVSSSTFMACDYVLCHSEAVRIMHMDAAVPTDHKGTFSMFTETLKVSADPYSSRARRFFRRQTTHNLFGTLPSGSTVCHL